MLITRRSMVTGQEHTQDLPVTREEMAKYESGALIQDAFPNLTPEQREFILSGTTEEEWKEHMEGGYDLTDVPDDVLRRELMRRHREAWRGTLIEPQPDDVPEEIEAEVTEMACENLDGLMDQLEEVLRETDWN